MYYGSNLLYVLNCDAIVRVFCFMMQLGATCILCTQIIAGVVWDLLEKYQGKYMFIFNSVNLLKYFVGKIK